MPPGLLPALYPWNRPLPSMVTNASAITLRAELPVHKNRTLNIFWYMFFCLDYAVMGSLVAHAETGVQGLPSQQFSVKNPISSDMVLKFAE